MDPPVLIAEIPTGNRKRNQIPMANSLNKNQLRAIQAIVAAAKTEDIDDKFKFLGEAAWFVKQDTDALLSEEITRMKKSA